jgi:hypothetical protein
MKIYFKSKFRGKDWQQIGQNFTYKWETIKGTLVFVLSFEFHFDFVNDEVQFARCVPYTYSQLT